MKTYIKNIAKNIKTTTDINYGIENIIKEFGLKNDNDTYYELLDMIESYRK